MPVRQRAVEKLYELNFGGVVFEYGKAKSIRDSLYRERLKDQEQVYVNLVNSIDWSRVLTEATALHFRRTDEDSHHSDELYAETCGECIRDAMLFTETFPNELR